MNYIFKVNINRSKYGKEMHFGSSTKIYKEVQLICNALFIICIFKGQDEKEKIKGSSTILVNFSATHIRI